MKLKNYLTIIFFVIFVYPTNAFSYFDPGSGSYLMQLLIAFIASCYFFITNPIKFIKSFFNKKKDKNENEKNENKPKD